MCSSPQEESLAQSTLGQCVQNNVKYPSCDLQFHAGEVCQLAYPSISHLFVVCGLEYFLVFLYMYITNCVEQPCYLMLHPQGRLRY